MYSTFIVEQKQLFSILSSMQPICTKRTTMDSTASILFHVGFKELVLKSTDLEVSLQSNCSLVKNTGTHEFDFLVSGKRIFDLVKELEGDITCTMSSTQLHLSANDVQVSLNLRDAQDFPAFPERIENIMQLDASLLIEMINKVAFVIPQNHANAALNGLYWELSSTALTMTATDGHCLAQVMSPICTHDEPRRWLLPRRAIFELKKIIESLNGTSTLFLGLCNNQLVFSGESFNFFTKLLNDSFPQYASILNKDGFVPARLDRTRFLKTLRRSTCFLSGNLVQATSFHFGDQKLNVTMDNKEIGRLDESISLDAYAGNPLTVYFYAPYLLNGVPVLGGDSVNLLLKNGSSPVIFQDQNERFSLLYLVMPIVPQRNECS